MACIFLGHSGIMNSSSFKNEPMIMNFSVESYISRAQAILIPSSDNMGDLFQIPELWLFMSVLVYVMGMGVVSRPQFSR